MESYKKNNAFSFTTMQRFSIPNVTIWKIGKISIYRYYHFFNWFKRFSSKKKLIWEQIKVRGKQIWRIGWMFHYNLYDKSLILPLLKNLCGFFHYPGVRWLFLLQSIRVIRATNSFIFSVLIIKNNPLYILFFFSGVESTLSTNYFDFRLHKPSTALAEFLFGIKSLILMVQAVCYFPMYGYTTTIRAQP